MNGRKMAAILITVSAAAVAPASHALAQDKPMDKPADTSASAAAASEQATDWPNLPIDELRRRADASEVAAMEELGRRLLQGTGVAKDLQAGAGWLLHAAELGSAQSAFNIGVMYERGFVVERDSSKAVEWYRKAADAGLPAAKHNLALLLRDGRGAPRDVKAAIQLLHAAALQGMVASMFSLGDIYEQGDGGTRDPASALAWFAVASEFGRHSARDASATLARTAEQRADILKRTLTAAELDHAQQLAQGDFKEIVAALAPPVQPAETANAAALAVPALPPGTPSPAADGALTWPRTTAEQVRAVQQALFDLKRLRDKPDGALGPLTRAAIRDFQKSIGARPTGEATKELYAALIAARHDIVSESPLPTPPQAVASANAAPRGESAEPAPAPAEPARSEPPNAQAARAAPAPPPLDLGQLPAPPPPPTSADVAAARPPPPLAKPPTPAKIDPPKPAPVDIVTTKPDPIKVDTTPPKTSPIDAARAVQADSDAWPAKAGDQVRAIQKLLRELRLYSRPIDGQVNAATRAAIRDYQGMAGLGQTGEPSRTLFESLKEMRKLMAPAAAAKPPSVAAQPSGSP